MTWPRTDKLSRVPDKNTALAKRKFIDTPENMDSVRPPILNKSGTKVVILSLIHI